MSVGNLRFDPDLAMQIVEKVAASAKSTSSVDKGGGLDAGISALPFVKSLTRASASANQSLQQ